MTIDHTSRDESLYREISLRRYAVKLSRHRRAGLCVIPSPAAASASSPLSILVRPNQNHPEFLDEFDAHGAGIAQ
jgi:hypothetical protein